MNTDHFKKLLLAKRKELQSTLRALEREGSPSEREAGDSIDDATASQGASNSLEAATVLSQTLEDVQDALRRMEDGSYGKCIACGREIAAARLEAAPWTPYCLEDQEKFDGDLVPRATL